jgi:hypothetical protein
VKALIGIRVAHASVWAESIYPSLHLKPIEISSFLASTTHGFDPSSRYFRSHHL